MRECFEARKTFAFDTLAQLTASGNAHSRFFDDIRHLLGRLGEHLKCVKTIVSASLRFPALFDDFTIQIRASPPSDCFFQTSSSSPDISLGDMAHRIFTREDDIAYYRDALSQLERTSNGTLLARLREERLFKTRVHAELLLVDLFYWMRFEFLEDDPYIGCSKPACFNCFQYILAHPGHFALPACHNKLYLAWRAPDLLEDDWEVDVELAVASKIREGIVKKMCVVVRAELRRQIDGKCARKGRQFDSTTGTGSSIRGDLLQEPVSRLGSTSSSVLGAKSLPTFHSYSFVVKRD